MGNGFKFICAMVFRDCRSRTTVLVSSVSLILLTMSSYGAATPSSGPDGIAESSTQLANGKKNVGIILYPGFEVLDVYGPAEIWGYVPDFNLVTISESAGPVVSFQGMVTLADYSFDDAPELAIILVPGGAGTVSELGNESLMAFLKERHERSEITTSVCTGSALLAASGVLKGHRATTNKRYFSLSVDADPDVDWVVKARWVDDGRVITSSGVTAGMDMALHLVGRLYGKEHAHHLASSIEYEWHDDPEDDPFARFVGSDYSDRK